MVRLTRSTTTALLAGAAVLTVALAGGAQAQDRLARPGPMPPMGRMGPGGPGGPGGAGGPGRGFPGLRQLDLTEAQRSQVRDVMERYGPQMREIGARLRAAHDTQRKAVEAYPLNEGLVRTAAEQVGAVQAEMALVQARVYSDVYALLSPAQQQQARELAASREARMHERQERMKGRRDQMRQRRDPPPQ